MDAARSPGLLVALALLLLASAQGCAHSAAAIRDGHSAPSETARPRSPNADAVERRAAPTAPQARRLVIEPDALAIHAGDDPLTGLDAYDARDLFRLAWEAYERSQPGRARALYERLLAEFPGHELAAPSYWNLALCAEAQGDFDAAQDALGVHASQVESRDAVEAAESRIRRALLLQRLGRFADSVPDLDSAAAVESLAEPERWEARILRELARGVVDGSWDFAEERLDSIRREIRRRSAETGERYPYPSAMLWNQSGELFRLHARSLRIDAVDDLATLDGLIGEKATLLLEARQCYKRSLAHRVAAWSGPSSLALGSTYEDFRADLLSAPRPAELSAEAGEVYDRMLRERTRQFLEAAVADYRAVLRSRESLLLEDAWVLAVSDALARCEAELGVAAAVLSPAAGSNPVPASVPAAPPEEGEPATPGGG
jgi:tetratricopeptide (TPR) repeat protein